MTREEAINKWIIPAIRDTWIDEKCDEIIKALDQGLCDDTISRQAAIDAICKDCAGVDYDHCYKCDELVALRALPSATPQPKTGHWIHHEEKMFECAEHWECSQCHRSTMTYPFRVDGNDYNAMYYCPKCGAKMAEK